MCKTSRVNATKYCSDKLKKTPNKGSDMPYSWTEELLLLLSFSQIDYRFNTTPIIIPEGNYNLILNFIWKAKELKYYKTWKSWETTHLRGTIKLH